MERDSINSYGRKTEVIVNKWKDVDRKLIKRSIQLKFLEDCKAKKIIPKSLRMKGRKDCNSEKYRRLKKQMEYETLRKLIWDKKKEVIKLEKEEKEQKRRMINSLNIINKRSVMERMHDWEERFKEKIDKEINKKRLFIGLDMKKSDIEKRIKVIGNVEVNKEEREFLKLGKNFKIMDRKWKKKDVMLDLENILYNEKKEEVQREEIRRKIIPLIERASKEAHRHDNLTKDERKGMKSLKKRRDIIIQGADKGGAITVMEKGWYEEKMEEQIVEDYIIIGKNEDQLRKETIKSICKNSEEGYGKKRGRNKRKKFIKEGGLIPKMKGLPKIHKEIVKLRPVVNGKGSVMEDLEGEMLKVFKILNSRGYKGMIRNSEQFIEEWKKENLEDDEIIFSMDVKNMFPSLRRKEIIKEIERLMDENELIRNWKKEEVIENLKYIWDNTYYIIQDKLVKVEDGLAIGSRMSPILAEIMMKRWEEEKISKEGRIRSFLRYVDDSIGIWKGKKEDLEEKVKTLEDVEKGIHLELEIENKGVMKFLDVEVIRRKDNKGIKTRWFQKKCHSGIYCNRRSDVDSSTKKNMVVNMEKRVDDLTSEKEDKIELKEKLWGQLIKNGYKRNVRSKEEERRYKTEEKEEKEEVSSKVNCLEVEEKKKEEKEEKNKMNEINETGKEERRRKRWYGITSIGKWTEGVKRILRNEGVNIFRKGGKRLEEEIKRKNKNGTQSNLNKEEEGVVYKINCSECDKLYIGETKFSMLKRLGQHQKDVKQGKWQNAIYKHTQDTGHRIDWMGAECLIKEERTIPRKILEGYFISIFKDKVMNISEGIQLSHCYKREGGNWFEGVREGMNEQTTTVKP